MAKRSKQSTKRPHHRAGAGAGVTAAAVPAAPVEASTAEGRRQFLKRVRLGGLAVAGIGALGWYVGMEVRAGLRESDLTRIGNGKPTIVQIHDPGCPTCRALQQQVRLALKQFGDDELQYVVANIRQGKGKRLAAEHGVPHVTLLLFDGKGQRREILRGPNRSDVLTQAFRRHLARG